MREKKGQISTEYMIVIGFITVAIIGVLGIAYYYIGGIRDQIRGNQLDGFANKIIKSAETVYYAGEPSKVTISAYLPDAVQSIDFQDMNLILTFSTSSGINKVGYKSNVDILLDSTVTSDVGSGVKTFVISAPDSSIVPPETKVKVIESH